jgi:large subunit ribosomal protein L25
MSDSTTLDVTLAARRRDERGTRRAGRLRREGQVPAVVYGLGGDNLPVSVSARELAHALSGDTGVNTLITLEVDGERHTALARQIQRNPVRGDFLHVDFIRVDPDKTVTAEVPIHLDGEPEGVKSGGLLEQLHFTLSIEAKPSDIPAAIAIDVSALEIGDQLRVAELTLPAGVTTTQEADELVAQVVAPRVEEEVPVEGEEGEVPEGEEGEVPAEGAGEGEGGAEAGAESADSGGE